MFRKKFLLFVIAFALVINSAAFPAGARALGSLYINTDADNTLDDGLCSLREAITNANGDSQLYATAGECPAGFGTDTITFAADYTITLVGSQLPAVTTAITINGNGEANTIVQANAAPNTATYRVFEVGVAGNLTLNNLTVRNGNCYGSSDSGGGIFSAGTLTASNVTFNANYAYDGGGMYNGSNATLTNVTFSTNFAVDGGGMYNDNGSGATLTDVTFNANSASYGGGMYTYSSSPTLTNVTFNANSASGGGGGMYNDSGSSPTLTDVTFSGNNSAFFGGGMYNDTSSPTLTNVTFNANSATSGGGIYNYNNSSPTLTNLTFSANYAIDYGGGMANTSGSSPTLTNVTFSANSAGDVGGGMSNSTGSPMLTNVTFSANSAANWYGGGMYNDTSSPLLTDVTFSANSAFGGGGMYNHTSSPTLTNVIIANSIRGGDCYNSVSTLNAASSNNLIEDAAYACGLINAVNGNIIGSGPLLGALANNGGITQTFALLAGSPAINTGTNTGCPASDQRGVARPQGLHCDIGAYEYFDLSAFNKSDPTNGITNVSISPTLSWNTSTGATSYEYCYDITDDNNCSSWSDNGTSTSKSLSGLSPNTAYYWHVRAVNSDGTTYADSDTWWSFTTVDAPTVLSISRTASNPTKAKSVYYTVTFSQMVTGVDKTDFAVATTGGITKAVISKVSGSGSTYTVTVKTGTGSGTLGLNLVDNDSIKDAGLGALGGDGAGNGNFSGDTYTVDKTAPKVISITRESASPTELASVNFLVTFSEPVTGVDIKDFKLVGTGSLAKSKPVITAVSGSGTAYTVTATKGTSTAPGTVRLDLIVNKTIKDEALNSLTKSFKTGEVYTVDRAPVVVSIVRSNPNPTKLAAVKFTVKFSEAVTGVDAGDFNLSTTLIGTSIVSITGSGTTWVVIVNTGTGSGTLGLNLVDDDTIMDSSGYKLGGDTPGNGNFTGQAYNVR